MRNFHICEKEGGRNRKSRRWIGRKGFERRSRIYRVVSLIPCCDSASMMRRHFLQKDEAAESRSEWTSPAWQS